MTFVLAAIDSDEFASSVLDVARSLAQLYDATPVALHVDEGGHAPPRDTVDAAELELLTTDGDPVPVIIAKLSQDDVVALVLGAGGVASAEPAGATALSVITSVAKPVVVVPPDCAHRARLTRLLVPLEGEVESSRPIEELVRLADSKHIDVWVLHIHSPASVPAFSDQAHHARRAWDAEFLARFVPPVRGHLTFIRRVGDPTAEVVAVAHDIKPDLIALGWSQNLAVGRAQIVRETVARGHAPVLLVPTASPAGTVGA